jgi:hypothetical protein
MDLNLFSILTNFSPDRTEIVMKLPTRTPIITITATLAYSLSGENSSTEKPRAKAYELAITVLTTSG